LHCTILPLQVTGWLAKGDVKAALLGFLRGKTVRCARMAVTGDMPIHASTRCYCHCRPACWALHPLMQAAPLLHHARCPEAGCTCLVCPRRLHGVQRCRQACCQTGLQFCPANPHLQAERLEELMACLDLDEPGDACCYARLFNGSISGTSSMAAGLVAHNTSTSTISGTPAAQASSGSGSNGGSSGGGGATGVGSDGRPGLFTKTLRAQHLAVRREFLKVSPTAPPPPPRTLAVPPPKQQPGLHH
jgi:uncharacterized membrane protein YgcG